MADWLANRGIEKEEIDIDIPRPLVEHLSHADNWKKRARGKWWTHRPEAAFAREMMETFDDKRTKDLLKLGRKDLRAAIGMLTCHGCLKGFLYKIGKVDSDNCRFCETCRENSKHIICECSNTIVVKARLKSFGKFYLAKEDLGNLEVKTLLNFARETGIYKTFFKEENS